MNASGLVVRTWNDAPISRRDGDGYADATAMCQANGRLYADYQRLDRTTAYLQALAASLGIPAEQLVITTTTGPNHLRGTWVHPRLAVDLARWLSPQFAVWMDGWFLEQLEQAKQQQQPTIIYAIDPRRRALPRHRAPMESLNDLGPSERSVIRAIHYARNVAELGHDCRTGDLVRDLSGWDWQPATIRWAIGRVRGFGLIAKRGCGWRLTERGAALAEQDESDLA